MLVLLEEGLDGGRAAVYGGDPFLVEGGDLRRDLINEELEWLGGASFRTFSDESQGRGSADAVRDAASFDDARLVVGKQLAERGSDLTEEEGRAPAGRDERE